MYHHGRITIDHSGQRVTLLGVLGESIHNIYKTKLMFDHYFRRVFPKRAVYPNRDDQAALLRRTNESIN
jgi:hypothetical protein